MIKRCVCALRSGVALIVANAVILCISAAALPEPVIITSVSKQFVVRGQPQRSMLASSAKENHIYLDPSMLAVTGERVRQSLIRELGWGERWQGTIYVNIHPVREDNEGTVVRPYRTTEGWRYRLDVPDELERTRLLETFVTALLLEFANRAGPAESVELPPWLVMGLTAHLMQGPLAGAALQVHPLNEVAEQPQLLVARTRRQADTDLLLRQRVQQKGALTVDQLNWPDFDNDDQAAVAAYRESAHLFVRGLLRLRGGPDCICAMVAKLPEHLNWQTAFLAGFETHFQRMLDVEKWWSLTITQFKTHDSSVTWSLAEAQQKLDEILYTPMQVRLTRDELPHSAPVALQTVISDWDFQQQLPLLQSKMTQLLAARMRLPVELVPVADSYRTSLEKYVKARSGARFDATARSVAKAAATELTALDEERLKVTKKMFVNRANTVTGPVPLTPQ